MAVIENDKTLGRARLEFRRRAATSTSSSRCSASTSAAEIAPDEWRRFRLVRGTYGQRQDNVQMLRIKIPQGIVTGSQMRALAGVAVALLARLLPRDHAAEHPVPLRAAAGRGNDRCGELADEGLTTREACGNSVRNITGCPYAGTSASEIFDVTPYAEALTRYFLRHPLSGVLPRKFKIAFEGCVEDHALASINDLGWRARIEDGKRGFRVTVAGGTSIMPVSGYVLYDFLPVEEMLNVAEAVVRVFHRFGDYEHRQRNRLKFMVKALGWDGFSARFEEALAEFRAEGGATLAFDPDAVQSEDGARLDAGRRADAAGRRRDGGDAGERPGHRARHRAAAAARRQPTCAGCAATSRRRSRTATATSSCGCRSATSRPGRCACWPTWPKRTATARCVSPSSRTCSTAG